MIRKIGILCLALLLSSAFMTSVTFACTLIYLGSDCTAEQKTCIGRSEDVRKRDYPKLLTVCPYGEHKKGERYQGCYGFSYTFSHDSYAYCAFMDDMSSGICPACGRTHPHSPYQAAGTNEKGLTVTATVTLTGREAVKEADPFADGGIEEAEIPTILLSEAATAREALMLLTSVYEDAGARGGSGILLSDAKESWYIENLSGREYLAVRLRSDMVMISPNLSVLGQIDLDDTEHVIASGSLIQTAKKSGCFVGDEKENVIDFAASYADFPTESEKKRLLSGLYYLTGSKETDSFESAQDVSPDLYTVTNLDGAGQITAVHSGIRQKEKADLQKILGFFRQEPIAGPSNAETHLFQITPGEEGPFGAIGWVSMSDNRHTVFVPVPFALTPELSPYWSFGAGQAKISGKKPDTGLFFEEEDHFVVFPEGFEQCAFWIFDAFCRICERDSETEKQIDAALLDLQREVVERWEVFWEGLDTADPGAAKGTEEQSRLLAGLVYDRALGLLEETLKEGGDS